MNDFYDVVVIGAGAAGLMCARVAGARGKKVLVLEKTSRPGQKILISGGGRCNFTNLKVTSRNYVSDNPHFCKSALARFSSDDFLALIKSHAIAYHEKKLGQLFCDGSAKEILGMLLVECANVGVRTATSCGVTNVRSGDAEGEGSAKFSVATTSGVFSCASLVVASGGLAVPKISSDFGYMLAAQFGLKIIAPAPALVPLTWRSEESGIFAPLAGVSSEVVISCGKTSFRDDVLFTHKGLSGPGILQISNYWHPGEPIHIDWIPDEDIEGVLVGSKNSGVRAELKNVLSRFIPVRLADVLCERHCRSRSMDQISIKDLRGFAAILKSWEFTPAGTLGFEKAEVTRGGVATDELSSQTMEAKKVPGLYFIGEVVDVTGWLGGYNFQWAWASGAAAGLAV